MITASTIGTNGRLGNQMFQYAALVGFARHKGYEFYSTGGRLFDIFEMHPRTSNVGVLSLPRVNERKFSFDEQLFNALPDNVDIMGYFQTKKYWQHCEEEVKNYFKLQRKVDSHVFNTCKDACFLHVRRTDYLNSPEYHTNLSLDYYKNALLRINPKRLIVLSDDIEWCKNHFIERVTLNSIEVIYANELSSDDVGDFIIMTTCNDAIIANSSFSWWGAYLGPHQKSGKIISPSAWFGPKGPRDTQDIYLNGWEIIS